MCNVGRAPQKPRQREGRKGTRSEKWRLEAVDMAWSGVKAPVERIRERGRRAVTKYRGNGTKATGDTDS